LGRIRTVDEAQVEIDLLCDLTLTRQRFSRGMIGATVPHQGANYRMICRLAALRPPTRIEIQI
jgi:hypothetical protein